MQETYETRVRSLGQEDPQEKGNGNPLQSCKTGESYGQRSLAGYGPLGLKESDMNEVT